MSDIDQQFIEYVVKSLVGKPEAVHIDRRVDEKGVLLELTVDPEDLGRVIGKRGATAQSLRTLLRALGTKNDARYNLKIVDNGMAPSAPGSDDSAATVAPPQDSYSDDTADDTITATAGDAASDDDTATVASKATEEPTASGSITSTDATEAPTATVPTAQTDDQTSDRLRRTRAELADLDDLDV